MRSDNLRANDTCSKLSDQLVAEEGKVKKMLQKLKEAKLALIMASGKEEELETRLKELQRDLSTKESNVASQEEALAVKD